MRRLTLFFDSLKALIWKYLKVQAASPGLCTLFRRHFWLDYFTRCSLLEELWSGLY